MTGKDNKVDLGVPRPYSNKKLPTPKRIVKEFVSPLKIWFVLFILSTVIFSTITYMISYNNEPYNMELLLFCALLTFLAVVLSLFKYHTQDVTSVPSITDVSKTVEYVRASSRLSLLTIISGIVTTVFIIVSHMSDTFYFIDDSTRVTIVILISLSYIGSYIIVKTLCSYSSIYKNSPISLPVNISSVPEIVTIIGFIVPPALVIYTGLIYNGPPIVDVPFSLSLIDTVAILAAIQLLYISLISRL